MTKFPVQESTRPTDGIPVTVIKNSSAKNLLLRRKPLFRYRKWAVSSSSTTNRGVLPSNETRKRNAFHSPECHCQKSLTPKKNDCLVIIIAVIFVIFWHDESGSFSVQGNATKECLTHYGIPLPKSLTPKNAACLAIRPNEHGYYFDVLWYLLCTLDALVVLRLCKFFTCSNLGGRESSFVHAFTVCFGD